MNGAHNLILELPCRSGRPSRVGPDWQEELTDKPGEPFPERLETVEEIVRSRLGGRITSLQVYRVEQGLILQGQSKTYYGKQLAQEMVRQVALLPIIANEIEVV